MKAKRIAAVVACGLILLGIVPGCKKGNGSNAKKTNCRIVKASIVGGREINISYDNDGRLSKVDEGDGTLQIFTYKGDSLTILETDSGQFVIRETVARNAAGMATYLRVDYDPSATISTSVTYEYSGTEMVKSSYIDNVGVSIPTNYTWFDGNLVSAAHAGNTYTYDYYTDKLSGDGDYFWFEQLQSGIQTVRTKNLVRTFSGNSFNYSYDADGKISAMEILVGGSVSVVNYTYQCS